MTRVVVLAGGTGGAKLAAGMHELIGSELTVVANTADDVEVLGVHVSPDPDLCCYWLAGVVDEERGWGIAGDGFGVFERMVALGAPDWFGLSDLDLAACLRRRVLLDEGVRQTDAQVALAEGLGIAGRVLPMCDEPVRTRVRTRGGWIGIQEFLIAERGLPEIEEVELAGINEANATPEVLTAIAEAEAIVIGPSNPVISIGPILAVGGLSAAIAEARAPVVAVSPFVGGRVLKGPTEAFMRSAGLPPNSAGIGELYGELLDGLVADSDDPVPPPQSPPAISIPTLMDTAAARRRVAGAVLEYALGRGS